MAFPGGLQGTRLDYKPRSLGGCITMKEDSQNLWFRETFQLKGSVIPRIGIRVGICTLFALIITVLHNNLEFSFSQPLFGNLVPSVVLGLLLVFRTNTAYDRFWDGRKLWGIMAISVRNLSRQIWVSVPEKNPQDTAEKMAHLRLLPAFATGCKLFLRG